MHARAGLHGEGPALVQLDRRLTFGAGGRLSIEQRLWEGTLALALCRVSPQRQGQELSRRRAMSADASGQREQRHSDLAPDVA